MKPDAYVPAFKDFVTVDESMYGLPFDGESTSLFYRKDLFEAAGIDHPPTTWEEMEADAATLTDPDQEAVRLSRCSRRSPPTTGTRSSTRPVGSS